MPIQHSCRCACSLCDAMCAMVHQPTQGDEWTLWQGNSQTSHCAVSLLTCFVQSLQGQLQTPARHSGNDSDGSPAGFSPSTPDYDGSTGGHLPLEAPASVISEVNLGRCLLLYRATYDTTCGQSLV
jgi:hypothetical protein